MDDNNEQEAIGEDGGDLFERIYLGRPLDNVPDVPFRLIIHSSVTRIDGAAVRGCAMLREIIFHENVIEIGQWAFDCCYNLYRIELLEGLLRLEDSAFQDCDSLREIVIPASVQYIGDYVFANCKSLQRVVFAPRVTSVELGWKIFAYCSNLSSVTLPQNLRSLPGCFFEDCTSLTVIQIPVSVNQIEVGAFCGSAIQSIKTSGEDEFIAGTIILPPDLRSIPRCCFYNCKSVIDIRIPTSVEEIGEEAFSGSGLRSIVIAENVRQIGPRACQDCGSLERVTIHSTNNLIMGINIFVNCPFLSVIIMYPWLWAKLFVSMNGQPDFIFKFFRKYQTQIFDFEISGGKKKRTKNSK